MIPKIIHYIWVGGNPLTPLAERCINSWKKYCPDYEIKRWDESNFDIQQNDYCKEAFDAKKWAFVSDYIRVNALYNFGGIYLDTDVELIKSFDDMLHETAFFGLEKENSLATCVIGCEKEHYFIKDILDSYNNKHFLLKNGKIDLTTNVELITDLFNRKFDIQKLLNQTSIYGDISIYTSDYFSPIDYETKHMKITNNTHSIHHFAGSWVEKPTFVKKVIVKLKKIISKIIGKKNTERIKAYRKKKRELNVRKD